MAMVLNYYVDNTITPKETSLYAINNGYRTYSNGTSWDYFSNSANKYNLEFMQTSSAVEALDWITAKEDPLIICSMSAGLWTNGGHFIVLWKVIDQIAFINDPVSMEQEKIQNTFNRLASECKQYFCFNKVPKSNIILLER